MKPPFAYYGGKIRLALLIAGLMPPHRVYLEPFAGSLAVLFAKTPAAHEVVNDVDSAIVTFFRVLRERPEDLERACRLTPYARDEFTAAKSMAADSDLEVARLFWVRVTQSFGKTAGHRTGWSVTTARTQSAQASVQGRIDRFHECAARLATVAIENYDAGGLITRLATADTVIYADPPYLGVTRNGRAHAADDYRHDMGSPERHEALAQVLHDTPATVFLSGYRSDLYEGLYRGWDRLDITVNVGSSNSLNVERRRAVECIWSNRPLTSQQTLLLDESTA